jgi:hypothetical protein
MLPDWPKLKQEIRAQLNLFMRERHQVHLGCFSESPQHRIFEGGSTETVRASGQVDETKIKEISAEFSYETEELSKLTLSDVLAKLDEVAKEMAEKFTASIYENIGEICEKYGNVTEQKGEPFSPESVIESWEKLSIAFDANGKPKFPQIHIHESMKATVAKTLEQLEKDPEYRLRMELLIEKKRLEWNAQEADRKLVG